MRPRRHAPTRHQWRPSRYNPLMSAAKLVAEAWSRDGIAMGPGVSDQALDDIERAHGVRLPSSFRELWKSADGTCAPDSHWLIFFQASDLVQALYGHREGEIVTLLFADWQQSMATFALQLGPEDRGVVVLGNGTKLLAPSFEAFLDLYLHEDRLWPRPEPT